MYKLVVFCSVVVAATAAPGAIAPYGVAPFGLAPYGLAAPLTYAGLPAAVASYNYRGPLSLAPGQPASVLATDGRPLDTLAVNLDRSAHIAAKVYEAGARLHVLKKRSLAPAPVPVAAPVHLAYAAPLAVAPVHALSPLALHAPYVPYAPYAPYARLGFAHAPIAHVL